VKHQATSLTSATSPAAHRFACVTREEVNVLIDHTLAGPWPHAALCIALHYQCFLEPSELAGAWAKTAPGYVPARGEVAYVGLAWRGLTVEDIVVDGELKMTLPSSAKVLVFSVNECDLVTAVLASLTKRQRTGPIACTSYRKPWPDTGAYVEFIRGFARAAFVTKKIRTANIGPADLRASGLEEATSNGSSPDGQDPRTAAVKRLARLPSTKNRF
jgi:hypothetical protein